MAIRRGSTPILTITAENIDMRDCTVYVTLKQEGIVQITKRTDTNGAVWMEYEEPNTIINVTLSQADTMQLKPGRTLIQLRWIEEDGTAHVSDIARIEMSKTLLEGVIAHVG